MAYSETSMEYYLFHATRIHNTLLEQPTAMNTDSDSGIIQPDHNRMHKLRATLGALFEMDIIDSHDFLSDLLEVVDKYDGLGRLFEDD